jgi:hypothetical protein
MIESLIADLSARVSVARLDRPRQRCRRMGIHAAWSPIAPRCRVPEAAEAHARLRQPSRTVSSRPILSRGEP